MSKPVVVIVLSLVAGIIVSDSLFYQRIEIPVWLDVAAWGFCLFMSLVAAALWRRELRGRVGRYVFPALVALFFAAIGFVRYASYAREVRAAWAAMERPPVNRGNPDEFDYVRWRWIQGVEDTTSFSGCLRQRAQGLRTKLTGRFADADMDAEAQAIVVASTLGDRSQLSPETRDLYAAAGASHLLALSGLHLSIIVGLFLTLVNGRLILSRWRPLLVVGVIAFVWAYAFVAGLPTSLVRASLMLSVLLVGSLLGHYAQSLHWLVLTAMIMLLIRPVCLFDVGAQLSFASVAGILVLYHRLSRWFFRRFRRLAYWLERHCLLWILTMIAVSLCAQAFSLPLVAYYFHQIPLYAPLFSVVLIPLTTVLIYGAALLLLITFVPLCAPFVPLLGKALSAIVAAELAVMGFAVGLPGAVVEDFWSRKAEPQVVVYNNWRCPAMHIIASPSQSWLLMPEPDSLEAGMRYIASTFWKKRLTESPVVLNGQQSVEIGGFKAVMLNGMEGWKPSDESVAQPLDIDLLWLTKGFEASRLQGLAKCFRPEIVVLDSSLPRWQRKALSREASNVGWFVYDVCERGALRVVTNDELEQQDANEGAEYEDADGVHLVDLAGDERQ